jgi:glycosyltransferase involved in cell wall biosynthesis
MPGSRAAGPAPVVLFLPARDEVATVGSVLSAAPASLRHGPVEHPVVTLVVDDGSTDGTGEAARAVGAQVVTTPGLGLGAAVRIGLAWAVERGAAAVAFCDADGEYDPAALGDLVGPVLAGDADYVVGSRFLGGRRVMRAHRWAGNRSLTVLMSALTRSRRDVPLTDGQSGYRALSFPAASAAEIAHDYNYAQVLTLDVLGRGFRYLEVPIDYRYRRTGRSFIRLPTYLRLVLPAMVQVRRRWSLAAEADRRAEISQVTG